MNTSTQPRDREENLLVALDSREAITAGLYQERLRRLLSAETTGNGLLTATELQRLRTIALISTMQSLTALGEGASASQLLRQASRR